MYKVVLVVLLVVITLICVSGQSLQSLDESHVEKGRDMKLRHGKRKGVVGAKGKGSGGKQLRLSQDIDAANGNYGTALPAFAFDYSEYLAGAVIERSSRSDNLYLTMFLVGHRTIDHDWPFEMVSTDEEVIYSWGNAARKWNVTSTQNNHRLTNADDKRSGIVCVMQGEGFQRTYTVPAHWVTHTDTAIDSTGKPITGTFEVLRCPIRGSNTIIYDTLSHGDTSLFVDLVRMKERNKAVHSGAIDRRQLENTDDRFVAVQQSQEQANADFITKHRNVIISFSVPWKSRQAGYGVNYHQQPLAGHFDMWQPSLHPRHKLSSGDSPTDSSNSVAGAHAQNLRGTLETETASRDPKLYVCTSGARPLHPKRADAGLPMLLEFVEHHINLGVQHIFLGVALDWGSEVMRKYMLLLQPYIEKGQVTISSLALQGYDDAMGFSGIKLNEKYADLFFTNQCLYLSKGIADYVVPLKPSQFLLTTSSAVSLTESLNDMDPSNGVTEDPLCSESLRMNWLPDPSGTFGSWGPADSTFSYDFFKESEGRGPLEEEDVAPGDRLSPSLMSTDHVWLANGHGGLVCGSGHSYIPSFKNSPRGANKGKKGPRKRQGGGGDSPLLSKITEAAGTILATPRSSKALQVWHMVEKLPKVHRKKAGVQDAGPMKTVLQVARHGLIEKGMGSIEEITTKIKANGLHIPLTDKQPQLGRKMKKPFWLDADTDHLNDVLSSVFKQLHLL
jgi:hypothetical protein